MSLVRVNPEVISSTDYDRAVYREPRWRAYFTNGERWEFHAQDHAAAMSDAHFWADFTGRELLAIAAL